MFGGADVGNHWGSGGRQWLGSKGRQWLGLER